MACPGPSVRRTPQYTRGQPQTRFLPSRQYAPSSSARNTFVRSQYVGSLIPIKGLCDVCHTTLAKGVRVCYQQDKFPFLPHPQSSPSTSLPRSLHEVCDE